MTNNIFINKMSCKNLAQLGDINFLANYFSDLGVNIGKPFELELADINDLATRCSKVLVDHSLADKLLPSTSYENDYFKDVQRVLDICNNILKESFNDGEYIELQIWY